MQTLHKPNTLIELMSLRSENMTINKVLVYIQMKYTNPDLTVEKVAEYAGGNRDGLNRLFLIETGLQIKRYISQLRLAKFKDLYIAFPKTPKAKLCRESGYPTYQSWVKHIKSWYNLTPQEYLNKLSMEQESRIFTTKSSFFTT